MILLLAFIATGFAQWRLALTASETKLMMELPLAKERMISDWYRYIQVGVRTAALRAATSFNGVLCRRCCGHNEGRD
jgi:methyl-accepting chemotaxis protein